MSCTASGALPFNCLRVTNATQQSSRQGGFLRAGRSQLHTLPSTLTPSCRLRCQEGAFLCRNPCQASSVGSGAACVESPPTALEGLRQLNQAPSRSPSFDATGAQSGTLAAGRLFPFNRPGRAPRLRRTPSLAKWGSSFAQVAPGVWGLRGEGCSRDGDNHQ